MTTSPALKPILDATLASFAQIVEHDAGATVLPNLLDVVQEVGSFVATLGRAMIQTYLDVRLRQTKAAHRVCDCGKPMEWLANSEWSHGTQFGDVRVKDAYAYCRSCHRSARPLHGRIGTGAERWSLAFEGKVVDLASDESCAKAAAKLGRQHPGAEVGRTSALRMLHRHLALRMIKANGWWAEYRWVWPKDTIDQTDPVRVRRHRLCRSRGLAYQSESHG